MEEKESMPSREDAEDQQAIPIEQLPQKLGFVETSEFKVLKTELVEAMRRYDWEAIRSTMAKFHETGEAIVEQLQGDDFSRAQIGLIVATALAWREAGKLGDYGAELRNALTYARHMKFDDVVRAVETAMPEAEEQFRKESEEMEYTGPPTEEIIAVSKQQLPQELHEELDYLADLPPDEALEELAALIAGMGVEEDPYDFFNRMGWTATRSKADWAEEDTEKAT